MATRISGPCLGFVDIDAGKHDTNLLTDPVRSIYVGSIAGGAAVKVKHSNGSTATYSGCIAGTVLPESLSIVQVFNTGTTATLLIGHK